MSAADTERAVKATREAGRGEIIEFIGGTITRPTGEPVMSLADAKESIRKSNALMGRILHGSTNENDDTSAEAMRGDRNI